MELGTLFFISAIALFAVRLVKYDSSKREYHWAAVDALSLLFFVAGFYFLSFPPANIIAYAINSQQYIFYLLFTIFYSVIMIVFTSADFLHAYGKI